MRKSRKAVLAAGAAAAAAMVATAGTVGTAQADGRIDASPVAAAGQLSPSDVSALQYAREEERLAHELYTVFADKYDSTVFSRIASSETRHFSAVGDLLTQFKASDPSAGSTSGKFTDPTLQALYDGWLTRGSSSLEAAMTVAAELERRDIADLQKAQVATSVPAIDRLFANLERASGHHLSAFESGGTAGMSGRTNTSAGTRMGMHRGRMMGRR